MKYLKMAIAVLLALSMFAMAGCAGGNTTWVYRSGETQVPAGLYIIYQVNAYSEAMTKLVDDNKDNASYVTPAPAEIPKMTIEGQSGAVWINAKAQESVRKHIAAVQKFESLGMQLSEENLAYIEDGVMASKQQESNFYERNGISDESLREYFKGAVIQRELFLKLYGAGGELEVPESELKEIFNTQYALVDIMPSEKPMEVPEGETKTLEQLTAEAKTEADAYLKRLQAGEAMEDLVYEQSTSQAETDEERKQIVKAEKGELGIVVSEKDRENYGDAFVDAVMAAKIGEPAILDEPGYYVIYNRTDIMANPEKFETYKETLLYELKFDEYTAKLNEWGAALQLETNSAAIDRYRPDKIKFEV